MYHFLAICLIKIGNIQYKQNQPNSDYSQGIVQFIFSIADAEM